MKKLLLFLILSLSISVYAQDTNDAFDKYAPPGLVYNSLNDALESADIAYKVKIENQLFEPKMLPKLGKLNKTMALQLSSNGITQLPVEFTNLTNLTYFSSRDNELTSLPKGLGNLALLTE